LTHAKEMDTDQLMENVIWTIIVQGVLMDWSILKSDRISHGRRNVGRGGIRFSWVIMILKSWASVDWIQNSILFSECVCVEDLAVAYHLTDGDCWGMLLFGPPWCGKTLIARQIGNILNPREPKIVNGSLNNVLLIKMMNGKKLIDYVFLKLIITVVPV
jgi:hypothetical protein